MALLTFMCFLAGLCLATFFLAGALCFLVMAGVAVEAAAVVAPSVIGAGAGVWAKVREAALTSRTVASRLLMEDMAGLTYRKGTR